MFSESYSSNYLSKHSYVVYILSITYIRQSINHLKTSYRGLTLTNSTILGRLSLDPELLVPRVYLYVCCCAIVPFY